MMEVVPAIIAKTFQELEKKIKLVEPYVKWAQLDIMDGVFAPEKSWDNPEELKKISSNLNFEAHLMVSQPEKEIERWINSPIKRILIHLESTEHLLDIFQKIKAAGLEFGVVLNLQTPISVLKELSVKIEDLEVVQLMGISEIGYHGHPFDERVISKIFSLRVKYPNVKIAVDGGINSETAPKAAQVGADILVAGSAIFGSDDAGKAIEELKNSIK